jgi:AAA+ ATPase superfamily predicted ATPase
MFFNREAELAHLEQHYGTDRAEMYVLYGRRRVGKTELLRAFCEGKPHVFFIATLSSDRDLLAAFSREIWRFQHTEVAEEFTFPSWEAAFRALADLPGRPIVVLDEFTYLISGDKAVPSILQKVWDRVLQNTKVFLVLCGSYVGMMEREVLGYQGALYGRRTANYLLQPLELADAALFFPGYSPLQQMETWAVVGGMPYYLRTFSPSMDVFANIEQEILDERGALYNEPHLLLMQELREPRNYFSILRAIAQGNTRLNAIAQSARVGTAATTARYLDTLQGMRLVKRSVPASEGRPDKSKKGLYQIADPFLRFWFRYVQPYRGMLEQGLGRAVLEQYVRPDFDHFVGQAFEEAARQHIGRLARTGELPFTPQRIGAWWGQGEEIDVVAISDAEGAVLVGECKWSARPVGLSVLVDLKRRAQVLSASGRWPDVSYALFSKAGFTSEVEALAAAEGIRLVQAGQLVVSEPAE